MTFIPTGMRIHGLRKERGWSQDELATRLIDPDGKPTTKATVSKIEHSVKPLSDAWLRRFSAAFGVSIAELLGEEPIGPVKTVPIVGTIAAGNWREAVQDPQGHIQAVNVSEEAFALLPDGDSMDQAIPAGGMVIIEPSQKELRDGKIYAVMNGEGETTLKVYRADPARLEPRSSNPSHRPIVLGHDTFTVLGRATQIIMAL